MDPQRAFCRVTLLAESLSPKNRSTTAIANRKTVQRLVMIRLLETSSADYDIHHYAITSLLGDATLPGLGKAHGIGASRPPVPIPLAA